MGCMDCIRRSEADSSSAESSLALGDFGDLVLERQNPTDAVVVVEDFLVDRAAVGRDSRYRRNHYRRRSIACLVDRSDSHCFAELLRLQVLLKERPS